MDHGYNIQVASNLTGLSIHTLRAWEKRYKAVVPFRTESGRRLYSDEEIEKLKYLSKLCQHGHSIGNIANKEIAELKEIYSTHNSDEEEGVTLEITKESQEQSLKALNHLILALENYRLDIISHEFNSLKTSLSPKELALNIVSPLMQMIGDKISKNALTIAQEHALSSIIRFHLGGLIYQSYKERDKGQNLVLLATPENDHHEFGILLAALLCIQNKINFFYIGPNMPALSLTEATKSINGTHIIIGTTPTTAKPGSNLINDYLDTLLQNNSEDCHIVLGGVGYFNHTKYSELKQFSYLPTLENLDRYLSKL